MKKAENRKHKKHHTVLPYITTPIVFVLLSLVLIVPMASGMMNVAVKTVHTAQKTLRAGNADFVPDDSAYQASSQKKGNTVIPPLSYAQKIGVVSCQKAGLSADVYYGNSRVSRRNGVGLATDNALCGQGGAVLIYGNARGDFKALFQIEEDAVIVFETVWGEYRYRVSQIVEAAEDVPSMGETAEKEQLILYTATTQEPFAVLSNQYFYVVADYISGPQVKEVQS